MRFLVTGILLFSIAFTALAQDDDVLFKKDSKLQLDHKRKAYFRLNFFGLGAGLEIHPVKKLSLYQEFGSGISIQINSNAPNQVWAVPYYKLQPRILYNIAKREEFGMRTEKVSANFISPYFILTIDGRNGDVTWGVGPAWGLQRNIRKNGYVSLSLGLGYTNREPVLFDIEKIFIIFDLGLGLAF